MKFAVMNNPKYSIIIPVHDALPYLKLCLESLFAYTEDYELLLWDNASSKETEEYLRKLAKTKPNILLVRHEENIGFVIPVNRMASKSKGRYLVITNSDVVFCKGWAEELSSALEADLKLAIVGNLGLCISPDGQARFPKPGDTIDYIQGSLMMIPRKIYEELGLFDENIYFCYTEDQEFSLRARAAGYKIKAIPLNVQHYHAKTRELVLKEKDLIAIELKNREYVREKWKHFPPFSQT